MSGASVTVFRPAAAIGKRFTLAADGSLEKTTAGQLTHGTFEVREVADMHGLVDLLRSLQPGEALSSSLPVAGMPATGRLCTKKSRTPGAYPRTKEHFSFRAGTPGVLALDFDPQPGDAPLSRDELWARLRSVVHGVEGAGVVWWNSSSSHVCHGERDLTGQRGQRFYILVSDAGDIPRASAGLAERLWLAGHGRVVVSKSGQKLMRHLFDDAMAQPARLDFGGGALCESPLTQRRGEPVVLAAGGLLDTRVALADLSPSDAQRVEALKAAAKDVAEPEARIVRERWVSERTSSIAGSIMHTGVGVVEAHERANHVARAAIGGTLLGDFTIQLDDDTTVCVGEVLDDRERYHGRLCHDPLEPDYGGHKVVGKLYLFGARPLLHSFAHGGATYRLCRQPARVVLAAGRKAQNAEVLAAHLAEEGDILRFGGVLVRVNDAGMLPIKSPAALAYLVGTRIALYRPHGKEEVAADLDDATAKMILCIA